MQALVMAGGKGTRMGFCGVEKPMIEVGGIYTIERVINALKSAKNINKILVSVSPETPDTKRYMQEIDIDTVDTSGDDYVEDLHTAFKILDGEYILTCPSDIPLLRPFTVDAFVDYFNNNPNDSMTAIIEETSVINTGITPSYDFELDGAKWVLSGMNIMHREKTLSDETLDCSYFMTDCVDLAINMNTQYEIGIARSYFI
ncbi:MAG: NTP transferase domain-containing protein [archaeon]|nr:NTP transferase domain-containing protein [archaeon]